MSLYGHKTAFAVVILSFGLFIWSWNCYMIKPYMKVKLNHGFVIGDFAMKSNFNNITLSVIIGFLLPLIIIISAKIFLTKKYKKEKRKKLS